MTRKKVKLAFIANDSSSKATYKKRKKGLMKKVNELSTLCGINACAIIYSPYDSNPEVWPSNSGVQRIISEFRTLPEMDQNKKMVDQETFLRQRIAKASDNLKKQRKDNLEMEMTEVMFQCLIGNMGMFNLNIMDLNDLGYLIDQCLKDVNRRIEILGNSRMELGESSNNVAAEAIQTLPIIHGSARVSRVDVHITF
ncbi:BnaC02g26190D [Brassica napus]|uniref:BnaC02g26190D protein n=1 Tax=Brassica napus TaxID=3708 RepID=A0A078H7X3_BRANA|nr:BnaC02g26190D [Brassica napus]